MDFSNSPVSPEALSSTDTLDNEPWQPVHPNYKTQLRIKVLMVGLIACSAPLLLLLADNPEVMDRVVIGVSITLLCLFLYLFFVWVPKRARNTRYLLRERDVHVRFGLWWRRTMSVGINRIQHLEITQGPIERWLGLSRLVLYTAGGIRADLLIPGLQTRLARQLKVQLLHAAGLFSEEEDDEG